MTEDAIVGILSYGFTTCDSTTCSNFSDSSNTKNDHWNGYAWWLLESFQEPIRPLWWHGIGSAIDFWEVESCNVSMRAAEIADLVGHEAYHVMLVYLPLRVQTETPPLTTSKYCWRWDGDASPALDTTNEVLHLSQASSRIINCPQTLCKMPRSALLF